MSILLYIALAITAVILLIVMLFYIFKGILILVSWILKLIPTMIKAGLYWIVVMIVYSTFIITNDWPRLPGVVYLILYFMIMALIFVRRYIKEGSVFGTSGNLGGTLLLSGLGAIFGASEGDYKGYVLNKKSKVIHEKYSDSVDTISPHNRKEISYSEARELEMKNKKYHFKK